MKWNSRKLHFAIFWQFVFTILVWYGKIEGGTYESLTLITVGGYLAANTISAIKRPNIHKEQLEVIGD